jgi:hypothetical protein
MRLIEIADLLGVSHQRASKIADDPGFSAPIGHEGQSLAVGSARVCGLGERVAAREALGLALSECAQDRSASWRPK